MFVEHKEAVEITPAKVLKLSEAIRIGAKIRPKCTGTFFREGRSCALGAAMEALGIASTDQQWMVYETVAPRLGIPIHLAHAIGARNDGWNGRAHTREQIADWLEGQGY